jgi:hypothetical protein
LRLFDSIIHDSALHQTLLPGKILTKQPQLNQPMKTKQIFAVLTILSIVLFASMSHAADITAINSGNWGDTNAWRGGMVPGTNDDADIPEGITVTVNTNASVQYIYDAGTVTMAANSTLNIVGDAAADNGTYELGTLDTSATGNTVIYSGNPFWAKQCNYYNLVFANTNYVNTFPPYTDQDFNNFSGAGGPTPMTIAGNWTLMGGVKVQQGGGGSPITIDGNLFIGTNCIWDPSGDILTVMGNTAVGGLLEDLNGALGNNIFDGSLTVNPGGHWSLGDVITWHVGGSLTNNGLIDGTAWASISFEGTGIITGSPITIPTLTIDGTYTVGTTTTLTTNYPVINGTVVFDLANASQIVLNAGTNWFWYSTNGTLKVINSGAAPVLGKNYQLFKSMNNNYGGGFASISLPSLPSGLTWVNNLLTSGSITVASSSAGSPIITLTRNGTTLNLTWSTSTYPGYQVYTLTNSAGVITNLSHSWQATGSNTSPATFTINPNSPPTFFRLRNP